VIEAIIADGRALACCGFGATLRKTTSAYSSLQRSPDPYGLIVDWVADGSIAEQAGLEPGDDSELTIRRDGQRLDIVVAIPRKLERRRKAVEKPHGYSRFGLRLKDGDRGLLVTGVALGSQAALEGFCPERDVILRVQDPESHEWQNIPNKKAFYGFTNRHKGRSIGLLVLVDGKTPSFRALQC